MKLSNILKKKTAKKEPVIVKVDNKVLEKLAGGLGGKLEGGKEGLATK
jgi:hypothetical protein